LRSDEAILAPTIRLKQGRGKSTAQKDLGTRRETKRERFAFAHCA
jgi:hypothetical protein